ncbi:hypothetical protein ABT364_17025 [Massilia sp. SR12]
MSDLRPPSKQSHFVLTHDVYLSRPARVTWVYGLRRGAYTLMREDEDGFYYQGEGDSVFLLSDERAKRYLDDGIVTPWLERYGVQLSQAGGVGGIWFPRDPAKGKIQYFYLLYPNPADSPLAYKAGPAATMEPVTALVNDAILRRPDTQNPVQAGVGGALSLGVVGAINSAVAGMPYKQPIEHITADTSLFKIIDEPAPRTQ